MHVVGEFIFAAIILMIWSVLYKHNPFYKLISSMSVGLMLAFWLKGGIDAIIKDVLRPALLDMNLARFSVLVLGVIMFLRFHKGLSFASKWPIAILAGVGTAIATKGAIPTMILSQITVGSFVNTDIVGNLNIILIWIGVISTLVYFIFSFKRGPMVGGISKIGQVYMMIAFGVIFGQYVYGTSVMAQMLYLLTYPGYYATIIAILVLAASIAREKMKTKPAEETKA